MYVSFLSVGSCFSWMRVLRTHERSGWFPFICWVLFNDQSINSLYNKSRLLICLFFEFQHSIMIWAFWQGSRNLLMKVLFPKLFLDLNLWSSIRLCRQLKSYYSGYALNAFRFNQIYLLPGHETSYVSSSYPIFGQIGDDY